MAAIMALMKDFAEVPAVEVEFADSSIVIQHPFREMVPQNHC